MKKKIISLILTLTLLCSIGITAFATNNETVGGKITLTQFIGTERNNATSVQLYIKGQLYTVDTKAFYDIADSMIITSNIEPYTITNDGIYICIKADEDTADFVYLSDAGIDRATPAPGRPLYSLYVPDDTTLINKLYKLIENTTNTAFSDIAGHWAEETINKWEKTGIISGYPDGTFKPDNSVTRAEFAKIITEAFDLQTKSILNYDDVGAEKWYYPYLECSAKYIPVYALPVSYETNIPYKEVYEKGLNDFLPETSAIRMHIAEALVKIKKDKENIDLELPIIQDIQKEIHSTFKDDDYENLYVMHGRVPENVQRMFEYTWLAKELDIMQGDTNGYFRPYDNVTRAELLTMIDRILEK